MKSGPIVATLLKLVKQFDDFVAPAATRILCSLLPEGLYESEHDKNMFSTMIYR